MHESLDDILRQVKHPNASVPEPTTLAFPGSGRYQLIIDQLVQTEDTYAKIATDLGCTLAEVRKCAVENGLARATPQNRATYTREKRIALTDRAFERIEEAIEESETVREVRDAVGALSQLITIRRLEDGEVTSRNETVSNDQAREAVREKLNVIAERLAPRALSAPAAPAIDAEYQSIDAEECQPPCDTSPEESVCNSPEECQPPREDLSLSE